MGWTRKARGMIPDEDTTDYDPMNPPAEGIPGDPLPPDMDEGDPDETTLHDHSDTPPGEG